jgi:hypothetical protein
MLINGCVHSLPLIILVYNDKLLEILSPSILIIETLFVKAPSLLQDKSLLLGAWIDVSTVIMLRAE